MTDKGYCSTKKLHYFGAKLHNIAFHRQGKFPIPEFLILSKASEHDLNVVREILPQLENRALIGDKADSKEDFNEVLQKKTGSYIYTAVKLVKGETQATRQFKHAADQPFSTQVSRIRQPIESLFNWIIEKTDIQRASKVRSRQGLIVHVFGRIAAAISIWVFQLLIHIYCSFLIPISKFFYSIYLWFYYCFMASSAKTFKEEPYP